MVSIMRSVIEGVIYYLGSLVAGVVPWTGLVAVYSHPSSSFFGWNCT